MKTLALRTTSSPTPGMGLKSVWKTEVSTASPKTSTRSACPGMAIAGVSFMETLLKTACPSQLKMPDLLPSCILTNDSSWYTGRVMVKQKSLSCTAVVDVVEDTVVDVSVVDPVVEVAVDVADEVVVVAVAVVVEVEVDVEVVVVVLPQMRPVNPQGSCGGQLAEEGPGEGAGTLMAPIWPLLSLACPSGRFVTCPTRNAQMAHRSAVAVAPAVSACWLPPRSPGSSPVSCASVLFDRK
mmetsp:Transcript_45492/g.141001  ORF Transcript_45492/g.141001 Transcript_45492/m.141001 type:complete len:239 (-) Transcript_45492:582-1298(-)